MYDVVMNQCKGKLTAVSQFHGADDPLEMFLLPQSTCIMSLCFFYVYLTCDLV